MKQHDVIERTELQVKAIVKLNSCKTVTDSLENSKKLKLLYKNNIPHRVIIQNGTLTLRQ